MCPAGPRALAGTDTVICGEQPSVSAREDTAKARLNSSLNPLSQCGIAYGTVRPGCDGNAPSVSTVIQTNASFVREEGELKH